MSENSEGTIPEPEDFSKQEIDNLIKEIIQKNRNKLELNHKKNKNEDYFTRVLEDKDRVYFIKDRDKKKKKEREKLSGEIINEARQKLGKDPVSLEPERIEKKEKNIKKRLRLGIAKKNKPEEGEEPIKPDREKEISEKRIKKSKTDEIIEGEEFNRVISEIENEVDSINSKEKNKQSEKDETIKKKSKTVEKEDKTAESLRPISKPDFTEESETTDITSNEISPQKLDKKNINSPSKSNISKIKFRVENIPDASDNEKKIVEEKIKEFSDKDKKKKDKIDLHKTAKSLAKKHIGKKETKDMAQKKDVEYSDVPKTVDKLTPNKDEIGHEHVFFDEDISSDGWSPHATEKEKNALFSGSDTELQDELKKEGVGEINDIELPQEALNVESISLSDLGFSENEWQELDFYPISKPFAYVEILREKETLEKRYFLVEVELTLQEQENLDFIQETIFNMNIETEDVESMGEEDYLATKIKDVIKEYNLEISDESFKKILYQLSKEALGFGKIDPLMNDPNIEDISCDGSKVPIFLYHRKYGSLKSNIHFKSEDELNSFVIKLAQKCGKHISIAEPMMDATMPDGSRIQLTLSDEITAHGSTFTIRKFRSDPFSPPDLVEFNTMSSEMIAYMWLAVENGINMLFAGGTASGKTSTLNALSLFIPPESKIVSIEETRELNLPHPNWIPGVSRSGFGEVVADKTVGEIDMYDLMKAALRQRPEYILVGEIRGKEAYVLFQAMATGHATYSTVHADSAQSLIHRLEGKPINIPRVMLQSLDVVSLHIITRVNNKRARRCKQIIEIIDIDPTTKEILTNEAFRWDPVEDKFVYSGKSYVLERIRAEKDLTRDEMAKELKDRLKIVEYMNNNNIRGFREVAHLVSRYLDNPQEVRYKVEKDV